jgi:hypothetical protein
MSRSDPRRVLRAQLLGTATAYAAGRLTRERALADLLELLTDRGIKPGTDAAGKVLTAAAAQHLYPHDPGDEHRFPLMVDLLHEAGAGLDAAARIATHRAGNFAVG